MAYRGYQFYIGGLLLPYAPSELKITIGSNNQTVELISGNEINILKNPKLTEIEFDVELPRGRQYAFANKLESPIKFTDFFEKLKLDKKSTELIIVRTPPNGGLGNTLNGFASSKWTVSLEDYTWKESADNAYDIIVSLQFKECPTYGTVKQSVVKKTSTTSKSKSTAKKAPVKQVPKTVNKNKSHTVKKGDCMWNISRKYYGDGSKWKKIYEANKKVIEDTAKKYGRKSSSGGQWIYPGTKLVIPIS
jgi:hypothetical protein